MESSQRHGVFPLPGSVSLTRVEMCCCCFDILVQRPTCSNNARNKVVSLATLGYNLDPSCENTEHLRSWSGRCGGKGRRASWELRIVRKFHVTTLVRVHGEVRLLFSVRARRAFTPDTPAFVGSSMCVCVFCSSCKWERGCRAGDAAPWRRCASNSARCFDFIFQEEREKAPSSQSKRFGDKKVECSCDWFPGITWVGFYKELRLAN